MRNNSSDILAFYNNVEIPFKPIYAQMHKHFETIKNGTYEQALAAHYEIDSCHNWCQRAFPNFEPSEIILDAPVLTQEILDEMSDDSLDYKNRVNEMIEMLYEHYKIVVHTPNRMHNSRRVTRALKTATLLNLNAQEWYNKFSKVLHSLGGYDTMYEIETTEKFWLNAITN